MSKFPRKQVTLIVDLDLHEFPSPQSVAVEVRRAIRNHALFLMGPDGGKLGAIRVQVRPKRRADTIEPSMSRPFRANRLAKGVKPRGNKA